MAPPRTTDDQRVPPPTAGGVPREALLGPAGREAELRLRLAASPDDADLLRGLLGAYLESGRRDPAFCVAAALAARGEADPVAARFFEAHRHPGLALATRRLSPRAWQRWVGAPEESPHLSAIFGLVAPLVAPELAPRPKALGLSRRRRRDLGTDTLLVSRITRALAETLGLPRPPELYVEIEAPIGLQAGVTWRAGAVVPFLRAGADLLASADERALGFAVGRALSTLRPEHQVVHLAPTLPLLGAVFFGAAALAGPRAPSPPPLGAPVKEVAAALARSASPAVREAIALEVRALSRQGGTLELAAWKEAVAVTANRAGLVLGGDLVAAAGVLADLAPPVGEAPPGAQIRALCRYAVSEEHFTARQELGLALPS